MKQRVAAERVRIMPSAGGWYAATKKALLHIMDLTHKYAFKVPKACQAPEAELREHGNGDTFPWART